MKYLTQVKQGITKTWNFGAEMRTAIFKVKKKRQKMKKKRNQEEEECMNEMREGKEEQKQDNRQSTKLNYAFKSNIRPLSKGTEYFIIVTQDYYAAAVLKTCRVCNH